MNMSSNILFQNITALDFIGNATSTCGQIQSVIIQGFSLHEHIQQNAEIALYIFSAIGFLFSIFMIFMGGPYFKPIATILSSFSVFWAIMYLLYKMDDRDISCELQFLLSGIAGLLMGVVTSFIVKFGLFLVGAGFFGASAHFFMNSFPELESIGNTPKVFNRTLVYYGVLVVFGLIGGVAIRCRERVALEACTAIIGSLTLCVSVMGFMYLISAKVDRFVYIAISFFFAILGTVYQNRRRRKREKRRRNQPNAITNSA
jgi:hypothetical protein